MFTWPQTIITFPQLHSSFKQFSFNCSCLPFSQGLKSRQASLWLEQVNKTNQSKVYVQPWSWNYNEILKRDGEERESVLEGKKSLYLSSE